MSEQKSQFGLNLLIQFIIIIVLAFLSEYWTIFEAILGLMGIIFTFGLIYGFFRLFGLNRGAIETFYQNFPIGLFDNRKMVTQAQAENQPKIATNTEKSSFSWSKVFTFQYLRYSGFLLIFSAIFSLLFQIDWELKQKIIAAFTTGIVFLIIAEILLKKEKKEFAATSSLISFGLLQFGLTLLQAYCSDNFNTLADPYFWLVIKTVFSGIYLFSLFRYQSKFQSFIYFSLAYITPFAMIENGTMVTPFFLEYLIPTVAVLSILVFWIAFLQKQYSLLTLNIIAFNLIAFTFKGFEDLTYFVFLSIMFVIHLGILLFTLLKEKNEFITGQITHNIALHIITLPHILFALQTTNAPELLQKYDGISLLIFAALTYICYVIAEGKNIKNSLTENLLNTSIIISSIGLLIEVDGKWTAIIFLIYSCLVLWYGIHKHWLRTIIYGFIFLTISIFRLYATSPELFESFTGISLILVIGLALLGLSYKFEKVKDYIKAL